MLIGIDFTGDMLKAALVEDGLIVRTMSAEAPLGAGPSTILDRFAEVVLVLTKDPLAVGIAIPGEVNMQGLCWRLPNTPGFEGVPIAEEVSLRLGCPVAVENRATAAALAEQLYGHGRRHPSFVLLTLGTGIGGGLVIGHQLYAGANGFGAEIGHICIDTAADAPLCGCGRRGCLEAFAGMRVILRNFTAQGGRAADLPAITASARRGELAGLRAFETMGVAFGRALVSIQNLLDLNAIVFSGALVEAFDLFEPYVRAELRAGTFAPPLGVVPLLVSDLGDSASVIGAAYLTRL